MDNNRVRINASVRLALVDYAAAVGDLVLTHESLLRGLLGYWKVRATSRMDPSGSRRIVTVATPTRSFRSLRSEDRIVTLMLPSLSAPPSQSDSTSCFHR